MLSLSRHCSRTGFLKKLCINLDFLTNPDSYRDDVRSWFNNSIQHFIYLYYKANLIRVGLFFNIET